MKRPIRPTHRLTAGIAACLIPLVAMRLTAQAPSTMPNIPLSAASSAPAAPIPAPPEITTQTSALPAAAVPATAAPAGNTPGVKTLTLDQVLAIALNNNSSVQLAREKIIKANELINEANAGGLPTISLDVVDTYSSNKTFGTASGGSNSTGTLPGGGQIPVITDTGGGNASSVTSSGGGGTATGTGATSTGTTTSTSTTATAGGVTTNTTPTSTTTLGTTSSGTTGSGTTNSGTSGTGTSGTGTSGTGTYGTTGPTANLRRSDSSTADLPPIMQRYAAATHTPAGSSIKTAQAVPHDTSTGTGDGTGQLPGNGSFNTGNSGNNNNYSAHVSVTQGIDLFNLVPAARDVESITRDFYVTDLKRVQNETALSVKDDYFNVLRDQEQVNVYQQQVTADEENVRVTQAQVTAGASPQYDVLTARTTLSNDQQLLSAAQDTLSLAQVNLNNLLGVNADTTIALQVPPLPPLTQTFDKDKLTQTAYAGRPELLQANNNIVIAQRLVKIAGASILPSLSIVGSGNYNGEVSSGSDHSTLSLSAVLNVPLYDGGTTKAKIREAESDLRSQQVTRSQLQQSISVEVRQALFNINDAQVRASSSALGVENAQEAYRLSTVRYQNGIGTILDVINAKAQLAQARLNLLNAQYDYQTSLAQLTRAIGGR